MLLPRSRLDDRHEYIFLLLRDGPLCEDLETENSSRGCEGRSDDVCLVSVRCCCWLLYVALCSGRSSECRVEVLEEGGENNLEETADEDVEEFVLVTRGWER